VEALALGNSPNRARDLAYALAGREQSSWYGTKVLQASATAARGDVERGNRGQYPTGASSIRSFFAKERDRKTTGDSNDEDGDK
jgi:hypothetical protein